jgi:thiamine-phosphate pyrophosphorylase
VRVVLITDRTRFRDIAERVAAIVRAVPPGSITIQVREKDTDGGPLLAFVRQLQDAAPGVPLWVNDRVDVALAADVAGVHLPEHGLSIEDARAVAGAAGRPLSIGVSRHTVTGALRADGADLVQLGPIYETPGKGPRLGPAALAVRAELPPATRLVAVGGIDTPERAREAIAAGADAIAVIRAAWTAPDPAAAIAELVDATGST